MRSDAGPGRAPRNFLTGIVTHPAYESDEAGAVQMEAEQAAMGLEKPPVQYVDAAYFSTQQLVQAQAEGLSCDFQNRNSVCDQKRTWVQKTGQWSRTRGLALAAGACRR